MGRAHTFLPNCVCCPDATKRPHGDSAIAVMVSLCPVKKLCEPSTKLLITTVVPRGYTMWVPLGCQLKPPSTLPAKDACAEGV